MVNANQLAEMMATMAQAVTAQANDNAQRRAAEEARDHHQRQGEVTLDQNKGLNDFRRQDPPKFTGGTDHDKADLWIQKIEKIFGVLQTAEGAKFLTLRQGSMSIPEYASKLESLAKHFQFFNKHVDERYMCKRFVNGLRPDIEDSVRPLRIFRFQSLVEKATEVELVKNKRLNRAGTGGPMRSGSQTYQGKEKSQQKKPYQCPEGGGFTSGSYKPLTAVTPGARNQSAHLEVTCFRCGKTGHYANACMNQGPRCFNCNQPGHKAVDCRAPKAEPTVNTAMGKRPAARGKVYIMDGEEVGGADGVSREKRRNDGNFLTIPSNF
ncbi:uncharacterized protein LOC130736310 [Lotus japonicus]|uniref:uncharacterized protein LOC130736310 n=1 Tax=Lotus japonicus TaxID=34305 RepID=UPI0025826BAA|nr:uncharacterized protein LOC130736310 [Lotus japonicus]